MVRDVHHVLYIEGIGDISLSLSSDPERLGRREVLVLYLLVVKKFQTVTRRPRLSLLRLKYFAANPIALPA